MAQFERNMSTALGQRISPPWAKPLGTASIACFVIQESGGRPFDQSGQVGHEPRAWEPAWRVVQVTR